MVADVELRFADVYQKPYFSQTYAEEVKKANLLILPSEQIREGLEPVFPEITSDFFRYLKASAPEGVIVDIAVDDENFRKLAMHSSPVALATLLIREEILEETVLLVTGFLSFIAEKNLRYEDEMDTFVNIIVESDTRCRKIMFSGRVSECKDALNNAVKKVFKGGSHDKK